MARWWNNNVGMASRGMYDDPWTAMQYSMIPDSQLPREQQPAIGLRPTAESLGMSQEDFDKYIDVGNDGSWSVHRGMDGQPHEKGFIGGLKGMAGFLGIMGKTANEQLNSVPVVGQLWAAQKWLFKNTVYQPLDKMATGAYWLYSNVVSQPLTTGILQMGKLAQGNAGAMVDGAEWSEAYKNAEHISPGQAYFNVSGAMGQSPGETLLREMLAVPTFGASLADTVDPKYQDEKYLYDTNYWKQQGGWKYSVGTGLTDAASSIFLDPTIFAGKAAKVVRGATRVVEVAEGATKGVNILGKNMFVRDAESITNSKKFEAFANWGIGKSPEEIRYALERGRGSRQSAFTSRDMSAQLADVLSNAKTVDDWRLAYRFAMGDEAAFVQMAQRSNAFALAYGKALDHRVNVTNADNVYRNSFDSLVDNNFRAKPIKPALAQTAKGRLATGGQSKNTDEAIKSGEFEFTNLSRSIDDRVKIDEQGRLFNVSPYYSPAKEATPKVAPVVGEEKGGEQLALFPYEVKPLDPASIPTSYYKGVQIPGLAEWRAGVTSDLQATDAQLRALQEENEWLNKAMTFGDKAATNPLFGSMREARVMGIGRDVTKQAERRQVQYLGAKATEGFQSRLLQNGLYGATVRFIGKMGDKLPTGVINHNEWDSAEKLGAYLKASPIATEQVADIVKNYSRIGNKQDSVRFMEDAVEPMLFEAYGKKYGMDIETVQEMFNRYRNMATQELGKARRPNQMYSAPIGEESTRVDQLHDGEKIITSPVFGTQNQYTSFLPNIKQFDRFLMRNADGISRMRKAGISAKDTIDQVADSFNTVFKLGNLLRVSYVARNVSEETMARAAKFGAMAIMSDIGCGGMSILRNRVPRGAVLDAAGNTIRTHEVNRSLPMVESMIDNLGEHISKLEGELARRKNVPGTFTGGYVPEDADGLMHWQDRIDNAKAYLEEFKSYQRALLEHASQGVRRSGEGTFHYRGQVVPEAFNEAYSGTISREQITSSDSWKTVFSRLESFAKEDMIRSGNYKSITPGDVNHLDSWEKAVNNQILQDKVGQLVVQDETGEAALKFLRSPEGAQYRANLGYAGRNDPAEHIKIVKAMIDQYIPEALRERAKQGRIPFEDFKAVPQSERPLVHGEELKASLGGGADHAFSWFDRLNEKWFQGIPRAASDRLSWHPTYVRAHRMHMQEAIDLYMNTEAKMGNNVTHIPIEDMNKLMARADKAARQTMREVLYDPSRTNFSAAVRNISPFFSAYADSMVRWGGLIIENPDLVGKMAKIYNAPVAANLVTDRYGNKVGEDGRNENGDFVEMKDRVLSFQTHPAYKNLPEGIRDFNVNLGSLNVVTPGEPWWNPGFGPVVAVPAQAVLRNAPELSSFLGWMAPYGTQSETVFGDIVRSITPAYIEDLWNNYDTDGQKYQDAVWASFRRQVVDYHQHGGDRPDWNKAQSDATKLHFLTALADFALPGKTKQADKYQMYIDAYNNLKQDDPKTARDKFMARYGKDFLEYTDALMFTAASSKSKNGVPSTVEGVAASREFGSLLKENPELGSFITGDPTQEGEFSQWALAYQKANGDRETVSAEDRLAATSRSAGWELYSKMMNAVRADMSDRGITNLQQKGAEDLAEFKRQTILAIANKYPEWADDYTVSDRDAVPKRIAAFNQIVSDPRMQALATKGTRSDITAMAAYLYHREEFVNMLAQRKMAGGSDSLTARSNYDIAIQWDRFRDSIADSNTMFSDVMDRYLSNDQLQTSVIG